MWTELRRKLFHLLALIYVVGMVYVPRGSYLLFLIVLSGIIFSLETLRLRHSGFGNWVARIFGPLMREKERDRYSGLFWMLLGVILTIALIPSVPVASAAILYLILGDAMAALIGKRLKGPVWPGHDKRISGSVACFLTCLLIGAVLLRPDFGWHGVFLGALTATVMEGSTLPIDDNVTIPVASAVVLMLCYRLTPGF